MHIYEGIGYGLKSDSNEYQDAVRYIDAFAVLFWIFGVIEFLIMFRGATLLSNKTNLLLIILHSAGLMSLLYFKSQASHYKWLLQNCIAFSFVPLVVESCSSFSSMYNYRRV